MEFDAKDLIEQVNVIVRLGEAIGGPIGEGFVTASPFVNGCAVLFGLLVLFSKFPLFKGIHRYVLKETSLNGQESNVIRKLSKVKTRNRVRLIIASVYGIFTFLYTTFLFVAVALLANSFIPHIGSGEELFWPTVFYAFLIALFLYIIWTLIQMINSTCGRLE